MKLFVGLALLLSASAGYAQSEAVVTEHCRVQNCYLESVDTNGKQTFFFTEEAAKRSGLDQTTTEESDLQVVILSQEDYANLIADNHSQRVNYPVLPIAVTYSWQKCAAGTIGSAGLAAMEGFAFGPWGAAAGAAFGGLVGAASFCDF